MNDQLDHLKRLSSVKSNTGVKFLTPAAFPGNHCPMHTALALTGHIKGLSSLVVGTPECGTYSRLVIPNPQGKHGELHWIYVLDEYEVVLGWSDGLIQALAKMSDEGAKAILLIITCVPHLIDEYMEAFLHEAQAKVSARLLYVMLGHFRCNSYPFGTWTTLESLTRLMEPMPTRPKVVNILGRSSSENLIPMPGLLQILEQHGFQLRFLAQKTPLDDYMSAPDAVLNVVVSPSAQPLAATMKKMLDIPFYSLHDVYSVEAIDEIYDAIASKLGISWGSSLAEQRRQALSLQEQAGRQLRGCRYISTNIGYTMAIPLAVYLSALGMEPLLLHLEEFYPDDKRWAKRLLAQGHDPWICHMVNEETDGESLLSLSADLCLGGFPGATFPMAHVPNLADLHGGIGYERTTALLNKIMSASEKAAVFREEN